MLPTALFLGVAFLVAFICGVAWGEYDDLETLVHRILLPDPNESEKTS